MTISRLLSLPAHGAAEMALGTMLVATPLVLEFGASGILVTALLGTLLVGLGLAGTADGSLSVATHNAFDIAIVAALTAGALAVGQAGERTAAALLLGTAAVELALVLTTRYSRGRP
jgi:hypothetical protein